MMVSYAQNFEDVMLQRVFRDQTTGFYIDIGVWDATAGSVTKHFYDRGWSGVNVEPLPENHHQIAVARPRDINLDLAVSSQPGSLILHHVHGSGSGLSTLRPDYARRHANDGFEISELSVTTKSLGEICAEYAAPTIDFLKIDVEGAEADVIKSGDFNAYRPRIVLVEATIPNSPNESFADWEPVLVEHGYAFAYFDGLNRFYAREEEPDLLLCFDTPPNVFDLFVTYRTIKAEERIDELETRLKSAMRKADRYDMFCRSPLGRILCRMM